MACLTTPVSDWLTGGEEGSARRAVGVGGRSARGRRQDQGSVCSPLPALYQFTPWGTPPPAGGSWYNLFSSAMCHDAILYLKPAAGVCFHHSAGVLSNCINEYFLDEVH